MLWIRENESADLLSKFEEPACMQVIVDNKIPDILLDHPEGLHVDVLAKKAALAKNSGLDGGKLGRVLRVLATKHCFKEGTSGHFLPPSAIVNPSLRSCPERVRQQSFEYETPVQ